MEAGFGLPIPGERSCENRMNAATLRALATQRRNTGHLVRAGRNLVETAGRTGDMAVASARTIGYRTARMVQALGDPVNLVDPEFARMGHEKVEAAMKSGQAVAGGVHDVYEV